MVVGVARVSEDFSRALRSESFCSPTADITLPAPCPAARATLRRFGSPRFAGSFLEAPQPLALDSASPVEVAAPGEVRSVPSPHSRTNMLNSGV